MTIIVDGERSRKRLPIAKRALAVIIEMGLTAKGGMFEGFFFKVWQMEKGELSGGRVVAPFGVYVLHVGKWGFKQYVCDSAQCAALPVYQPLTLDGDRYVSWIAPVDASRSQFVGGTAGGTAVLMSPHVGIAPTPAEQWKPPQPVCIPFSGEGIAINAAYERTSGHWVDTTQVTHCHSDGRADLAMPTITGAYQLNATTGDQAHRVIPMLISGGYFERVVWKPSHLFLGGNAYPLVADYQYVYAPTGATGSVQITADQLYPGASATFLAKIRDAGNGGVMVRQIAAYFARTATDVKGVTALYPVMDYCTDPVSQSSATSSCVAQAEIDKWGLSLSITTLSAGHQTVDYSVLKPELQALADGELAWLFPTGYGIGFPVADASRVLANLFGSPAEVEQLNGTDNSQRDTVTFADSAGVVYSWLRCTDPGAAQRAGGSSGTPGGGFKFSSPAGFERVALAMPAEVKADTGLRPRTTLMTATTYYCVADRADGTIANLYVGSPFASWEPVPLPAGATMYAVRVMQPGGTGATTGFIGVGKDALGAYRVYMQRAGAAWVALSSIPAPDVNDLIASWDVCVFGDDPLVAASQQVRQHPVAVQSRRPELR